MPWVARRRWRAVAFGMASPLGEPRVLARCPGPVRHAAHAGPVQQSQVQPQFGADVEGMAGRLAQPFSSLAAFGRGPQRAAGRLG